MSVKFNNSITTPELRRALTDPNAEVSDARWGLVQTQGCPQDRFQQFVDVRSRKSEEHLWEAWHTFMVFSDLQTVKHTIPEV